MTSGRKIDHVVVAVKDLDASAKVYEALGFTLTPRAAHEDRMGTSNRLAQFAAHNFIELLEVDRPRLLLPHDFEQTPPFFSFGEHNRRWLSYREGMSMLVFAGDHARGDHDRLRNAGIRTYAPFDFDRFATLPDGSQATVSFTLTFATSPDMPNIAFFVCENRAQEYFWKPAFQSHENRATGIKRIYLASPHPDRDAAFIGTLFNGAISRIDDGMCVACGPDQDVWILKPDAIAKRDPTFDFDPELGPLFAGMALQSSNDQRPLIPSQDACGVFIEWL